LEQLLGYLQHRFQEVKGWCRPEVFLACAVLCARQESLAIGGGTLEIGAHRGRFFAGLALLVGPSEPSLAIDLFDAEHLRLDRSGMGADRTALAELIASVSPEHRIDIRAIDSLSIGPVERVRLAQEFGSFAFISIDGGHTAEHVYCDFETAEALIAPGGVVMIDDYYSARWPGVHDAVTRHFHMRVPRLAPFAFFARKLWMTTPSHHAAMLDAMETEFCPDAGITAQPDRMFGYPTHVIEVKEPAFDLVARLRRFATDARERSS
jgi:hypothetical protein